MSTRVDDPTIGDDEILWRRILPEWLHREPDGASGRHPSLLSTGRHRRIISPHCIADQSRACAPRLPNDSLVAIRPVTTFLGYAIVRDATDEDPSHAIICPSPNGGNARKIAKQFLDWVVLRPHQPNETQPET